MRGSAASWARVECMVKSALGGGVGAAGWRAVSSARPSRPSAAGRARRPRPLDATSPDSPFCGRLDVCRRRNAPDWCSLAGQFDTWSEWRGPGKTTCSLILAQVQRRGERAGSISARHSFRTLERKVCGQELRLVLFCSSHESSGPKLLAVQLPHGCLRTLQHVSRRPQNGESGNVASDGVCARRRPTLKLCMYRRERRMSYQRCRRDRTCVGAHASSLAHQRLHVAHAPGVRQRMRRRLRVRAQSRR